MLRRKTFEEICSFPVHSVSGTYRFEGFNNPDYVMANATENQHDKFPVCSSDSKGQVEWDADTLEMILELPMDTFNAWIIDRTNPDKGIAPSELP